MHYCSEYSILIRDLNTVLYPQQERYKDSSKKQEGSTYHPYPFQLHTGGTYASWPYHSGLVSTRDLSISRSHSFVRRHHKGLINYSCCQSFRLLVSRDQLAMSLPSSLSTDCVKQEIDLFLHNEGRKESVWKSSDSLGCLLVLPGPIVTKNRHIEES